MKRSRIWCAAIGAALLGGCAIGPDYQRPVVETPVAFKETANWKIAEPRDEMARGKWWKIFGDSDLDALIEQVNIANQSLKAAEARYRQATALTQSARASYFPTVSANASSTRSRGAAARSNGNNEAVTNYNLTLSAGWELDLWGRIRRTVEANDASAQASAADLESARLSLQSELATNYFQLRVNDAQKQLFADTIVAFEKSLELTRNRYAVGVAGKVAGNGQIHFAARNAHGGEQLQLGDGDILAVARAAAQSRSGIRPIIGFAVEHLVVDIADMRIGPGVDRRQIGGARARRHAAHQRGGEPARQAALAHPLPLGVEGGFADRQPLAGEEIIAP